jgi:RHS repeat-associated protein
MAAATKSVRASGPRKMKKQSQFAPKPCQILKLLSATKEKTSSIPSLAALLPLSQNLRLGFELPGEPRIGQSSWISSTSRWGYSICFYETASETPVATYYRDASGLDYAQNRYYANTLGRFTSPDPYMALDDSANDPSDPRSWNQYVYVKGDPVTYYDPEGLLGKCPEGTHTGPDGKSCAPDSANIKPPRKNVMQPRQPGDGSPQLDPPPVRPLPAICNSKIFNFTSLFADMGTDLGINPLFIMAVALQESGWNLSHVYETNASSGGQPLNNLFGMTYAGGDNIAYPTVKASATAWEANWGPYLSNKPKTIQGFVTDLVGTSGHMYNTSPNWPIAITGGTYPVTAGGVKAGDGTIGTYQSISNWMTRCGKTLP